MGIPDYTESLPALLSARQTSIDAGARGVRFDVKIGGVGFILAPDAQNPYLRETAEVQKQQIDTSREAGEQSFSSWWTRHQTSWHRGAGANYYEPGSTQDGEVIETRYRFSDSRGVDVWTQGQLTLLRKMDAVDSAAGACAVAGAYDATDGEVWFSYFGTTLRRHESDGTSTDYAASSSTDPGYGIAVAGSKILVGGGLGVYSAPVAGGAPTAFITQALATGVRPYWVKSRVGITKGAELHFHALTSGTIDATSLHWAHPDSSWRWTGMAETPDAILASGHAGGRSAIFAMVMTEDAGDLPVLSQPIQVAELPPGEVVTAIKTYLGRYLAIGTNRGLRLALIGTSGQIQYGPLIVETDSEVTSLEARGEFVYAAAGSRAYRVSLAETIDGGLLFPYAADVDVPSGTITGLAFFEGRLLAAVDAVGTYLQSDTEYVSSGWIESGKIRYATTVPKAFRQMDVNATTTATDSVAVEAVINGSAQSVLTLSAGLSGVGLSLSKLAPQQEISYRLTLNSTDGSTTPQVDAVAVRAYPTPPRQRYVQFPLLLADFIRDSKGTPYGWEGYANQQIDALEAVEQANAVVTVEDRTRGEQFEASIEKVAVRRVEPRAGNGDGNFGGTVVVTVKTL